MGHLGVLNAEHDQVISIGQIRGVNVAQCRTAGIFGIGLDDYGVAEVFSIAQGPLVTGNCTWSVNSGIGTGMQKLFVELAVVGTDAPLQIIVVERSTSGRQIF